MTASDHKAGAIDSSGSASYFNLVSSDYYRRYEEQSPGGYAFRVRKQRLLELMDGCSGRVLDVGCGPGVLVPDLLDRGFEVWGVDAAPKMIEECHRNFQDVPQARFSVGNAVKMEFPADSFDVVICAGVIDHIRDYERVVTELLRVLRKDGLLVVAFPNLFSPWAWWRNFVFYPLLRRMRPFYCSLTGRPQPPALASMAKLHSERNVVRLIHKHKGDVAEVVYYNFNQLLSPLDEIFPQAAVRVAVKLEKWRCSVLRKLGGGFIVKVRKQEAER